MKVVCQLFNSFEVHNIDIRPRNNQLGVISPSHHNWNYIYVFTWKTWKKKEIALKTVIPQTARNNSTF